MTIEQVLKLDKVNRMSYMGKKTTVLELTHGIQRAFGYDPSPDYIYRHVLASFDMGVTKPLLFGEVARVDFIDGVLIIRANHMKGIGE